MEGASFVSKKTGEFSPENSWVKIAWMQFLPAFQGSACASLPNGNGYAALPIGARLCGKYKNKANILEKNKMCIIIIEDTYF